MIRLYLGINETKWNHHPVEPGDYACISPVYGKTERTKKENSVKIPADTIVIEDSGAHCDAIKERLSFRAALDRQLSHSDKYKYISHVSHIASYDVLIDEVWVNGNRHKRRWSENDAEWAVNETVQAAKFLALNYSGKQILSAQGVTPQQYLDCSQRVLEWVDCDRDIFGLGGWCITGKMKKIMMPVFRETIREVIPLLAKNGVKRVHIWGVLFAPALGNLLWICDQYNIQLSTDSSGPSWRPAFGEWGYADWRDKNYVRPDVSVRGHHRMLHVLATRLWLSEFRNTQYYKSPNENIIQREMF